MGIKRKFCWIFSAATVGAAALGCIFLTQENAIAFADGEIEINVHATESFSWNSSNELKLQTSEVYTYSYSTSGGGFGTYYSASEMNFSPRSDWSDWQLAGVSTAEKSVFYAYADLSSYSVSFYNPDLAEDVSQAGHTPVYAFEAGPVSGNAARGAGRYQAQVTLTPNSGYKFVTGTSEQKSACNRRGVSVTINPDGTATVRKTWYVLQHGNALMGKPEEASTTTPPVWEMPSWQFGAFDAEKVAAPTLGHGDEAYYPDCWISFTEAYEMRCNGTAVAQKNLGAASVAIADGWNISDPNAQNDVLLFSISMRGVSGDDHDGGAIVCENQPRSQWSRYINEYMPVGEYAITISVSDIAITQHPLWWSGAKFTGGETGLCVYSGFSVSYEFSVGEGELRVLDGEFKQKTDLERNIDGVSDGNDLFGVLGTVQFGNYIGYSDVVASGTYWAEVAEEYYGVSPSLVFNLARSYDNVYRSADDDFWTPFVARPDTFHVFSRAEMKNYRSYPDTLAEKYEHWFEVTLYRELTVPRLEQSRYTYTGSPITAAFSDDTPAAEREFYAVTGQTALDVSTDKYKITVSLPDKKHYRWKTENGGGTDDLEIEWEIVKADENWVEEVGAVGWKYGDYNPSANRFKGVSDSGISPFFTVAIAGEDGEKDPLGPLQSFLLENGLVTDPVKLDYLKKLPAGRYYLNATIPESLNYNGIDSGWVEFTVTPASNYWAETPNFIGWKYGEYNALVNRQYGRIGQGTTEFMFYRLDENGDRTGDGYTNMAGFGGSVAEAPCGSYEMLVTGNGGENFETLSESVFFEIGKGENRWLIAPNITSRVKGDEAGFISGTPQFGTAVCTVTRETGETMYDGRTGSPNAREELSSLRAGNYTLTAFVVAAENYTGIGEYEVLFRVLAQNANRWTVTPSIQGWTEGESPNEPVGAALFGTVEFRYYTAWDALLDEVPAAAGQYKLVATVGVYADETGVQYEGLRAEISFTVAEKPLLVNRWKKLPSIRDWQQGETASEPSGEAEFGGTPVFTYATADGTSLGASKPTQAGDYLLIATVGLNGYETLTAQVPFKITPPPSRAINRVQDTNGNLIEFIVSGVPGGSLLNVGLITDREETAAYWSYNAKAISEIGCSVGAMYDLALQDASGNAVVLSGTVAVTISIPAELRGKAGLQVAYVSELGEVTLLGGKVQGDKISFQTDHFSTYCLIWAEPKIEAKDSGSAGAIFLTVIIELCFVAAVASSVYALYFMRKNSVKSSVKSSEKSLSETVKKPLPRMQPPVFGNAQTKKNKHSKK